MEEYHWSYDEYMNTPQWIIDTILEKRQIDYKLNK